MDAGIFKTKNKSATVQGKASNTAPASKPDPTPTKTEQPAAKPKGRNRIIKLLRCQIVYIVIVVTL